MTGITVAPYGSWVSPISAALVADSPSGWIGSFYAEGDAFYMIRNFPQQGGRGVVSRYHADGRSEEITPAPFYARTRVYEYGGACFAVQDGVVYFSNVPDDRIYRQVPGQTPEPITEVGALRYADFAMDPRRQRLICVREDNRGEGEARHTIAAVNLAGDTHGTVLFDGSDFVAFPVLSPDGSKLAWVAWDHPHMPFYSSTLWVADVMDDGSLANITQLIAHGEESITDPRWSPDNTLYFCSDRSNWWNLYRWVDGHIEAVCPMQAEFGNPFWNIGLSIYRFLSPERIVAFYNESGTWRMGMIDTVAGSVEEIPTGYTFMIRMELVGDSVYMVAASPTQPRQLVRLDLRDRRITVLESSVQHDLPADIISAPVHIGYPTEGGLTAYGFYHPPHNPAYRAPDGELPPLIVECHGGPTGSTKHALDMRVQYWTSRGFAVLSVNYGGSAGYGRDYRNRLRGNWGIVDVQDAINGARYLVAQGLADGTRTVIGGGSAGGFTTFAALAFQDYFQAGSSHFGISDLETWHLQTHKYESHYCETLVGPYPAARDLYLERSPVQCGHAINAPMVITQGLDDKIVPPNQSRFIVEALQARSIPVLYLEFEGEGHGFRRFETNLRVLQEELVFLGQVLGFTPAADMTAQASPA